MPNYNTDDSGRLIPLEQRPQILGHEFCGVVIEASAEVKDLKPGDRVVIDQGINCLSRDEVELCEYCATGSAHQCAQYKEHGITGLPERSPISWPFRRSTPSRSRATSRRKRPR